MTFQRFTCETLICEFEQSHHITCAQKLGYLIDNNDSEDHNMDPYHMYCKKHSNTDTMKRKRDCYARMMHQEEARMVMLKRRRLDEREIRKMSRMKEHYLKRLKGFEGNTITWPNHDVKDKRARLLPTSSRFLEAFGEKAELAGVDREEWEKAFTYIPTGQLPVIPPAFTDEFWRYYNYRETKLIPEEESRLATAKRKRDTSLRDQRQLEQAIRDATEKAPGKRQIADVNKVRLSKFHQALANLGIKVKKPKTPSPTYVREQREGRPAHPLQPNTNTSFKVLSKPVFSPKTKPNILRKPSPIKIQKEANLKLTISLIPPKLDFNGPSSNQTGQTNGVYEIKPKKVSPKTEPKKDGKKRGPYKRKIKEEVSSREYSLEPPEMEYYPKTPIKKLEKVPRFSPNIMGELTRESSNEIKLNECFKCKKNTDQHLIIFCGGCKHHYHLGCLDPPLKRMPKLRKNESWECSDCVCPSDSEEDEIKEKEPDTTEDDPEASIAQRRPKRERSNILLEQRKQDEEEMNKAFRRVMSQDKRRPPKLLNVSNTTPQSFTGNRSASIKSPTLKMPKNSPSSDLNGGLEASGSSSDYDDEI